MKVLQSMFTVQLGYVPALVDVDLSADLVLCFGPASLAADQLAHLARLYPNAVVTGCSTAGEILRGNVNDHSLSISVLSFENAWVKAAQANGLKDIAQGGMVLAGQLPHEDLRHVLIFSDGLNVNGTQLASCLAEHLPKTVTVSGGLAADDDRFEQTYTWLAGHVSSQQVVAVGLYGASLSIGFGSYGGWDSFGPERLVTKSKGNVLYELDHYPALTLYKDYLGEHAKGLPSSALLFPLSIRADDGQDERVRTILGVDESTSSLTFAGDIPENKYVRLMRANFERLIEGAGIAAEQSFVQSKVDFALLVSCVGRKMVLNQRIEEEIEVVAGILGDSTRLGGFYSYGELSPLSNNTSGCTLHNQTMTITTISEDV